MESWQFLTGVGGSEGTVPGTFPPSRKVWMGQIPTFAQGSEGGFTPSGGEEGGRGRGEGRKWDDCWAGTSAGSGNRVDGAGGRVNKTKERGGIRALECRGRSGGVRRPYGATLTQQRPKPATPTSPAPAPAHPSKPSPSSNRSRRFLQTGATKAYRLELRLLVTENLTEQT